MRQLAVATLLVLGLALPAYAQSGGGEITKADLEDAAQVRREVGAELADVTALYEANVQKAEELADSLSTLGVQLAGQEQQLGIARDTARGVAREMYMAGGSTGVTLLLDASSFGEISLRRSYMDLVSASDTAALAYLQAVEARYSESSVIVATAIAEQAVLTTQSEQLAELILRRLNEAESEYRSLVSAHQAQEAEKARLAELERLRREEAERKRIEAEKAAAATTTTAPRSTATAAPTVTTDSPNVTTTTAAPPPPPAIGGRVCPVDGPTSFVDSFGARRSGGRSHEGVDMISKRGTPLVAIEAGSVKRMRNGGLGGITVWLRGEEGDEFYYAHLDAWADGLSVGDRVEAGELLGYVGSTGNASYNLPHLHFEYHPDGGRAVNPYPLTAELCL